MQNEEDKMPGESGDGSRFTVTRRRYCVVAYFAQIRVASWEVFLLLPKHASKSYDGPTSVVIRFRRDLGFG